MMLAKNDIFETLRAYLPISLEDMKEVRLMNRLDTKYVVSLSTLKKILEKSSESYYVQTSENGECFSKYRTVYFDTVDKQMYITHETGRLVREKIRMRQYLDTRDIFLEIKDKDNHKRTKKKRIVIPDMSTVSQNKDAVEFLSSKSKFELSSLTPHMENEFRRVTLVNKEKTERLTIDLNLSFHNLENNKRVNLDRIAIIELKRDGLSFSPMKQLLMEMHVHEMGFSKYCIGCAMTNLDLRQNNLKSKIRFILKMNESQTVEK